MALETAGMARMEGLEGWRGESGDRFRRKFEGAANI